MPICARTSRIEAVGSRARAPSGPSVKPSGAPLTRIVPAVASSKKAMQRNKVLLPDPDGPIRQVVVPRSMARSMPCSTSSLPKLLETPLTAMAGPVAAPVMTGRT